MAHSPKTRAQNFPIRASRLLVKKSAGIDWLSEAIALRQDIPEVHFRKLISKASKAVIQKLQAADPKHANLIEGFLGNADDQDADRKDASCNKPKAAMLAAGKLTKQEELTEDAVRELQMQERSTTWLT